MSANFFESYALAKRAMKNNLFTEVYLSTAVTTPVQLKGWVSQPNPYERHGQRWRLYLSRVEILRRLAGRNRAQAPARKAVSRSGTDATAIPTAPSDIP